MHRTVLNMARSMIFASRLPLSFWGDAVEYASYILNRSPTSANEERASPMEILTKRAPDLRDIVVFGSVCSVYRDPRKNSGKKVSCRRNYRAQRRNQGLQGISAKGQ